MDDSGFYSPLLLTSTGKVESEVERSQCAILPPRDLLPRVPLHDLLIRKIKMGVSVRASGVMVDGGKSGEFSVHPQRSRRSADTLPPPSVWKSSGARRGVADGSRWEVNVHSLLLLDKQHQHLWNVAKRRPTKKKKHKSTQQSHTALLKVFSGAGSRNLTQIVRQ